MALISRLKDSVSDTTNSTGTGDITLNELPPIGARTFGVAYGSGTSIAVCVTIRDINNGDFETCLATYNDTTKVISRGTIYSSSNSDSRVNFQSGEKTVEVTIPSKIFGSFRWRVWDCDIMKTYREIAFNSTFADTSLPASPQYTFTVQSGDICTGENVSQICFYIAVNFTYTVSSVVLSWRLTKNGTEIAGANGTTTSSSNGAQFLCQLNTTETFAVGDVIGIKVWRGGGTGTPQITSMQFGSLPYKVTLDATDFLMIPRNIDDLIFKTGTGVTFTNVMLAYRTPDNKVNFSLGSPTDKTFPIANDGFLIMTQNTTPTITNTTLGVGVSIGGLQIRWMRKILFSTLNDLG